MKNDLLKNKVALFCAILLVAAVFKTNGLKASGRIRVPIAHGINQPVRNEISGLVTDSSGSPLPGVTVYVKDDKSIGTTTDLNGRYILQVPDHAVLIFTMVGFQQQEVDIANKTKIDIRLLPATSELAETVVVAFGSQKRSDMVGSVVNVNPGDLKVPSSNLTTALAGKIPGMIAFQRSGEPGQDNAHFFIRGVSSFGVGKKDPLILVDGVETTVTDFAQLRPSDIENFSVLKDATATSVYGSRAANGVILVKTKSGKEGKATVSLRIETSLSEPTDNVEFADPVTYMKMYDAAQLARDPFANAYYPQEKIIGTERNESPYIFPATDWREKLFKKNTVNQRYYLNISGGGKVARYFVSGSLYQDHGLLNVDKRNNFNSNINLKKYSLRANVDVSVTNTTKLIVRLNGNFDDYVGPVNGGASLYNKVVHTSPVDFPAYYPTDSAHALIDHILFGGVLDKTFDNPYADMVSGYKNYSRALMMAQIEAKQDFSFITKGLSLNVMMNTHRLSRFEVVRAYNPFYYYLGHYDVSSGAYGIVGINPEGGKEYLGFDVQGRNQQTDFYFQSVLNYDRTFGNKHKINGLLVYMVQSSQNTSGDALLLSLPHRNLGISGRFSYSYDSRYYAEFDFGYNGSERFAANNRFGFFPSIGLAWTVSNEKFWDPMKDVVNNFRIRATYGKIGNDQIGSASDRFFYLSDVNMSDGNRSFKFGLNFLNEEKGISIQRYANNQITWEVATKANLGIELGLFNGLNLTADFYKQDRRNILMTRVIPGFVGLSAGVKANVGQASSTGMDLSLNYTKFLSNRTWLKVMGNFTYAHNKFVIYEEPVYKEEPWLSHVGYPLSQPRGFIAKRLFIDDKDVANSPPQEFGSTVLPGDIKYLDVNEDGTISDLDKVPLGFPKDPEIVYGFGISFGYKNFDVSTFFQGLARESFWINPSDVYPFVGGNQLIKSFADSHFSPDNPDIYALMPRFSINDNANNEQLSSWWLRNGAFLRLKQAELGYTIASRVTERWRISTVRIYVNGTNLLLFSPFKLWDVEMGGDGLGYPVQRVYNIGINVKF